MKRLATEITYLLNRFLFGFVCVPGILWLFNELGARYLTANQTLSPVDYYQQFYSHLDSPVTWLWIVSPYLIFLLTRPRRRVKIENEQPCMRKATSNGRGKTIKKLIDEDAKAHGITVRGQSPLQLAAMTDNVSVVRMLIDGGADIDAAEPGDHFRPLHNAATNGCTHVCELLLKHGADMDAQTTQGDSALSLAATNGHADIVSLLLSFHANHAICNAAGFTAEQLATARGYHSIVELIKRHSNSEWPYPRMVKNSNQHLPHLRHSGSAY